MSIVLKKREDSHIQTLHLLSAHIKLLLDAPEHLWRLIEKKKFLSATWLFFLTRVVHRVLVSEDEQDAGSWSHQNIHVIVRSSSRLDIGAESTVFQKQFPLVQRQWDVISQFRSQIIQKATSFLRECSPTAEVRLCLCALSLIANSQSV
jgi:conserved oligomeric Golgi complex subunit 1